MTLVLWCAFGLSLLPAVLVLWNLSILRRPEAPAVARARVSVLIPARNESANIGSAIAAALAADHADASAAAGRAADAAGAAKAADTAAAAGNDSSLIEVEVIVLDDHSTDDTAAIVGRIAQSDRRVRLLRGRPLPTGACGKPFACAQLADAASGDVLVFVDADVRLAPGAVALLVAELERSGAAMISGVPRQVTDSFGEKLIVPLIHFVLLGFLPFAMMRSSTLPAFGAACGQLIVARRTAYLEAGGHGAILPSMHDGLTLARVFRRSGFRTDVTDVTRIASCRMYGDWRAVWHGFAKNAHEGLGSPGGILPWSILLLGGQCLPLVLLPWLTQPAHVVTALAAILLAYTTRCALTLRFEQSWLGCAAHPLGVAALVAIQWYALLRRILRRPVPWKSRVVGEPLRSPQSPVSRTAEREPKRRRRPWLGRGRLRDTP